MKVRSNKVYDAIQWKGDNLKEVIDLIGLHNSVEKMTWFEYEKLVEEKGLKIIAPNSSEIVEISEWIIKTPYIVYVLNDELFKKEYEEVAR